MAYLVKADLTPPLFTEQIDKITRSTNATVDECIDLAITEAKGYLSRYNLTKLFDPDATGYVVDKLLKRNVAYIACWHLINLQNVSIDYEKMKVLYDNAIAWLEDIQKGKVDPPGWPYRDDDTETEDVDESAPIHYVSNPKRNQHF